MIFSNYSGHQRQALIRNWRSQFRQKKPLVDAAQEAEGKSVAVALKHYEEVMKQAQELGIKVYKPTPEEMKLWTAGKDEIRQQVFKDQPQVLEEIKKLEEQVAAYRQKK